MLLLPHVLVRILELGERERLGVDDGTDVVLLDGAVHVLELGARTDEETADGADVVEAVEEGGLVFAETADEADDACVVGEVSGEFFFNFLVVVFFFGMMELLID